MDWQSSVVIFSPPLSIILVFQNPNHCFFPVKSVIFLSFNIQPVHRRPVWSASFGKRGATWSAGTSPPCPVCKNLAPCLPLFSKFYPFWNFPCVFLLQIFSIKEVSHCHGWLIFTFSVHKLSFSVAERLFDDERSISGSPLLLLLFHSDSSLHLARLPVSRHSFQTFSCVVWGGLNYALGTKSCREPGRTSAVCGYYCNI